jgi:serine/threonine protein kinase
MRFIKRDSLDEAIRRFHGAEKPSRDLSERSLALRQLLDRFLDVCNTVAYAHSCGIIHRDLKPANIMLGKYGETLVVDWGLAKLVGRPESAKGCEELTLLPSSGTSLVATEMYAAVGTPAYMSPEQAAGRLDLLGPASDIYSLGATLYCLLTGHPPFTSGDREEVRRRVQAGDFPLPRALNEETAPALEAVCLKAMALQVEDRYASPRALADDLERWLANEPVTAYCEPWLRKIWRVLTRPRHPTRWLQAL